MSQITRAAGGIGPARSSNRTRIAATAAAAVAVAVAVGIGWAAVGAGADPDRTAASLPLSSQGPAATATPASTGQPDTGGSPGSSGGGTSGGGTSGDPGGGGSGSGSGSESGGGAGDGQSEPDGQPPYINYPEVNAYFYDGGLVADAYGHAYDLDGPDDQFRVERLEIAWGDGTTSTAQLEGHGAFRDYHDYDSSYEGKTVTVRMVAYGHDGQTATEELTVSLPG